MLAMRCSKPCEESWGVRLPGKLVVSSQLISNCNDSQDLVQKWLLVLQVDNALTAVHNVLFSKGLDTAVATSRQQHAANVEAAHEAREAYLKKACFCACTSYPAPPACAGVQHRKCDRGL